MSEAAWLGLGVIVATFIGPIAAVFVTRFVDRRREEYKRRLDLFRVLMRSRRVPLSSDFVGALNLIEVEFFHDREVLQAWRALLSDLEESIAQSPEDEVRIRQKRDYLRAVLLSQMAKSLRFRIPDLEIFRGGYSPQGHVDAENEWSINRKFFAEIAQGRRAFPIVVAPPQHLPPLAAPAQVPIPPP